MPKVARLLKAFVVLLISPPLVLLAFLGVALWDVVRPFRRKLAAKDTRPSVKSASVVIPNWNGKELLAAYLPSVVTARAGATGLLKLALERAAR